MLPDAQVGVGCRAHLEEKPGAGDTSPPRGLEQAGGKETRRGWPDRSLGSHSFKKKEMVSPAGFWIPCWDNSGGGRGCSSLIWLSYPHPYLTPFRVGFFTLLPLNRPSDPALLRAA